MIHIQARICPGQLIGPEGVLRVLLLLRHQVYVRTQIDVSSYAQVWWVVQVGGCRSLELTQIFVTYQV